MGNHAEKCLLVIVGIFCVGGLFCGCAQTTSASDPGLNFTVDSGIRIEAGSVPFVLRLADDRYRMFFASANSSLEGTAISSDGFVFSVEAEGTVRGTSLDTTILNLGDCFRIFYLEQQRSSSIVISAIVKTATSEDGLNFSHGVSTAYAGGDSDNQLVGVPDEIILADGTIRMFYVGDAYGKNNVRSAVSYDQGLTFTFEAGNICGDDAEGGGGNTYIDPDILQLPNGRYRLYVMHTHKIYSFSSADGLVFTLDEGIRLQPSDFVSPEVTALYDPEAILLPDNTIRLFCGATDADSNQFIVSATAR